MSKSEKNKNYLEKLKENGKYEEYKRKKVLDLKKRRAKRKEEESKLSNSQQEIVIKTRRKMVRDRVRKHRENKKKIFKQADTGYRCANTLGKATKKIERNLPHTASKRTAALAKVLNNLDCDERNQIFNTFTKNLPKKQCTTRDDLIFDIRAFYERDDVSRVSPKMKDVKKYKCVDSVNKIFLPTRHMVLTIRETYALFVEDRTNSGKGNINLNYPFV